jgi:hypothetical protein
MSCHSCGGFEHFTTQEMSQMPEIKPACMSKESMNQCLYTAQGMFLCNKPDLKEELGVAKNYWMVEDESTKNNFGLFMQK